MKKEILLRKFSESDNTSDSKIYLDKFFIDNTIKRKTLLDEKDKIFRYSTFNDKEDSDFLFFKLDYCISFTRAGLLLTENDFLLIKKNMIECDESKFYIIEDFDIEHEDEAFFLEYPADINWNTISQENSITYQLFSRPIRNYFIFGEKGQWGRYVANDFTYPICFLGAKEKSLVNHITEEEKKDFILWYPKHKTLFENLK